jgi:hypothetical protein
MHWKNYTLARNAQSRLQREADIANAERVEINLAPEHAL